jgi:hypothetical protein
MEITRIPVRTVQHWRTRGLFVPALPLGTEEGHRPGELYALGDAVGLRLLWDLLNDGTAGSQIRRNLASEGPFQAPHRERPDLVSRHL